MKEQQVDFVNQILQLDGEVRKNLKGLILPIDEQVAYLLQIMIKQNVLIRGGYKEVNDYLLQLKVVEERIVKCKTNRMN